MQIGYLKGNGILRAGGKALGSASYEITVTREAHTKTATGTMRGEPGAIFAAQTSADAELEMAAGKVVKIVISQSFGDGSAEIKASGPVPGF